MHYPLLLHVFVVVNELRKHQPHDILGEFAFAFLNELVEVPIDSMLKHEIEVLIVLQANIKLIGWI